MFASCFVAIGRFGAEIQWIPYLTLKIKGQGHSQVQIWWSYWMLKVQSIWSLFVSRQSDYFWPKYSKFHIWTWKFRVKVTTKIDQNKSNQVIYRSGPSTLPKMKEIWKVFQKLSREQDSTAGGVGGTCERTGARHTCSHPWFTGVTELERFRDCVSGVLQHKLSSIKKVIWAKYDWNHLDDVQSIIRNRKN